MSEHQSIDPAQIQGTLAHLSDRFSALVASESWRSGAELMKDACAQCKKLGTPPCAAEGHPECHLLRQRVAEYRIADEASWSKRIIHADDPQREYQEYLAEHFCSFDFLAKESSAIDSILGSSPQRVLFIGSGALPVTPMWLRSNTRASCVDCLECLPDAVALSRSLLSRLGYESMNVIHDDARTYDGYAKYNVVILALLAELTCDSKCDVISRIGEQLRPGSLLISRTAVGAAHWMFPSIQPELVSDAFQVRAVIDGDESGIGAIVAARTALPSSRSRRLPLLDEFEYPLGKTPT